MHFQRPQGGCKGFRRQRRHKKWRPKGRHTFPAERYYITPEGGSTQPACKAKPITGRTLAAQGQRPGGWLNPHARKGVSTYRNTGKHRPDPDPDPDRAISPIKKAALRQQVDYCLFIDASSSKAQEISSCFSSSIITSFSTCCSFILVSASIKRTRFTTGCNKYFVYV